jgi:tetratricopeptide (TPR) repeat protein
MLSKLGHHKEAIVAYDDLLNRFGNTSEAWIRAYVALALYNNGFELSELGHHKEAIVAYDDVIDRFGNASEELIREVVAKARGNKEAAEARRKRRDPLYRFGRRGPSETPRDVR